MSVVAANYRPARLSGGISVILALASVGIVGGTGSVWLTLFVAGVGIGLLALGTGLRSDSHPLAGSVLVAVGASVVLLAFGLVVIEPRRLGVQLWLVSGIAGVVLVSGGVIPFRARGARHFLRGGAFLLFLTVLLGGLLTLASLVTLLSAGVATFLVGDVGENAISVGEQLGRASSTARIELAHLLLSSLVGALAVVVGLLVVDTPAPSLSLGGFLVLLLAIVLLAVAVRN